MLSFFKKNWPILVVLFFTFWALKALLVPGYFPAHDDEQIARIFVLDKAIKDGEIPVRWVSDLGFGFGYPLFNFYPPFTYYAADLIHQFGFSFINSAKALFILGFLVSSFFMYLWSKEHIGKLGGVFAAFLFTYAPYHAVEIYVRGSLPEFWSYALFPISLWSFDKLFKKKNIFFSVVFAFVVALIPLIHILNLVYFFPILGIYIIYFLFTKKGQVKKFFPFLFLSLLIAFGLTAFFLIPAILEKNFTMVDKINTGELYSYKLHFVCLKELFNSAWGYGGSLPDCNSGLSYEIGKFHILFVFIALIILIYSFLRKKMKEFRFIVLALFLFLFSAFMTNSHSSLIWDNIKLLSYLQFPWRFLTVTALFSSFIGGFVISFMEKQFGAKVALVIIIASAFSTLILVVSDFQPQKYLQVGDEYYTNYKDIAWRISKASFEFVPNGIATKLSDIKTTQLDINEKDIPTSPYKVIIGDAHVNVISNKSQTKIFNINSKNKSVIQLSTFSFPGWKTYLDGKEIKYSDKNKLKLITVNVPPGMHTLEASFTNTLPRAVGNAITLVTFFNLLGLGLFRLWKK